MPEARAISIQFPLGGLDRTLAFQSQPPYTTPLCKNIWPYDVGTDRARGGIRPGLDSQGEVGGAPYAWCRASYIDGTTLYQGIAVCYSAGTRISLTGSDWGTPPSISSSPGTNFATCELFQGRLVQARGGGSTLCKLLPSGVTTSLTSLDPLAPSNCGICIRHMDRLWLMGDTSDYHVVYASAVGTIADWDTSDPTDGGAFVNSGPEGGAIGSPVTAAIRHNQTILLVGGPNSLSAFRGNPRVNGATLVSDTIGPLGQSAWCKGVDRNGNDNTYMMTYDGLYVIPAGSLQVMKLSKRKIPRELLGLLPELGTKGNNTGPRVSIGFDSRWEAIHIAVDNSSGADVNYTYSIAHDSYWPTDYTAGTPNLFASFPQLQSDTTSSIYPILSGGTGYLFDVDSTEEIDSNMLLGPIMLGDVDSIGILHSITASLAAGSDSVNFEIYAGDSVEEAYTRAAAATDPSFTGDAWTYSASQFLNNRQHPRVRGHAAYIRVFDSGNERWLLEEIIARLSPAGIRKH